MHEQTNTKKHSQGTHRQHQQETNQPRTALEMRIIIIIINDTASPWRPHQKYQTITPGAITLLGSLGNTFFSMCLCVCVSFCPGWGIPILLILTAIRIDETSHLITF